MHELPQVPRTLADYSPMEALTPALDEVVTLSLGDVRIHARVDAVFPSRLELALDDVPLRLRRATSVPGRVNGRGGVKLAGLARLLPATSTGTILAEFCHADSAQELRRRWALAL